MEFDKTLHWLYFSVCICLFIIIFYLNVKEDIKLKIKQTFIARNTEIRIIEKILTSICKKYYFNECNLNYINFIQIYNNTKLIRITGTYEFKIE